MGIWKATQIPMPPQIPPGGEMDIEFLKTTFNYVKELAQTISAIRNDLEFMLNGHLDVNNIRAKSITADRMDVDELSAITANLGHIISGLIESVEIYGSYIATRRDSYPRVEMSNTDDLFSASYNENNKIHMQADYGGVPSLNFIVNGNIVGRLNAILGTFEIDTVGTFALFAQNGNIDLSQCINLITPRFSNINSINGDNLAVILDSKATAGISTNPSGSHNHGIPDGTELVTADGGTVTFRAVGPHTHEQTS